MTDRSGYVYLLKSPTGYWKIGRTKNPDDRRRTFNVKLPFEVEFEALIACEDMYVTEGDLHAFFRNFRVNGEWFKLSDKVVEQIKQLKTDDDFIAWHTKVTKEQDERARQRRRIEEYKAAEADPHHQWPMYWRGDLFYVETQHFDQWAKVIDETWATDGIWESYQ